jgi:hypothetical protein
VPNTDRARAAAPTGATAAAPATEHFDTGTAMGKLRFPGRPRSGKITKATITCKSRRLSRLGLGAALLLLATSGCTVTVRAAPAQTTHANEAGYRQMWQRDWSAVIDASTPWNPAGSTRGACNQGADINVCYRTDQAVLPLLHTLYSDLSTATVPSQYTKANAAMVSALNSEGQGLSDRDAAIRTNDDALFRRAVGELRSAASQLMAAYLEFPQGDRPTPQLFGPGRHSS